MTNRKNWIGAKILFTKIPFVYIYARALIGTNVAPKRGGSGKGREGMIANFRKSFSRKRVHYDTMVL